MRTFIAIDIPLTTGLKKLLHDLKANLKGTRISYTNPGKHHITLTFLGESSPLQVTAICNDLKALSYPLKSFEIKLNGLEIFKSHNIPRILWVGINTAQTIQILCTLANEIAKKNGISGDFRNFEPHISIGRIKSIGKNNNLGYFMEKYKNVDLGKVYISGFVFYQSIITSEGTKYKPIEMFKLLSPT